MILLSPMEREAIRSWFTPEEICYNVAPHVLLTGHGAFFVDQWPAPRVLLADVAANCRLYGDPSSLPALSLPPDFRGMIYAPASFDTPLQTLGLNSQRWDRVYFELTTPPAQPACAEAEIRRLAASDAYHVWALSHHSNWLTKSWGGPAGFAASGRAWGAFVENRLVAVACVFIDGNTYEELGVVTEPVFRGQGFSAACTARLCEDIQQRNHIPTWSTSPDNLGSIRVAEKVGFAYRGAHWLHMIDVPIHAPPTNPALHI